MLGLFQDLLSYLRDGTAKWLPKVPPPEPGLTLELICTIIAHPTQPLNQLPALRGLVEKELGSILAQQWQQAPTGKCEDAAWVARNIVAVCGASKERHPGTLRLLELLLEATELRDRPIWYQALAVEVGTLPCPPIDD